MKKIHFLNVNVQSIGNKKVLATVFCQWFVASIIFIFLLIALPKSAKASESYNLGDIHIGSYSVKDVSTVGKSITYVEDTDLSGPTDLTETLQDVQGVTIKRIDGQSGIASVRIRGSRSIDTQVMYDGIELRDPSDPQGSANPLLGDLLSGGISDAEILRGASSALYGSKAVGGVINLRPQERLGGRLWGEYGTFNTFNEGVDYGFKTNGFGEHYLSFQQLNSDGFDAHDEYSQSKFSGKSIFHLGDLNDLTTDYLYSNVGARLNSAPFVQKGVLHTDADDENDKRSQELWHFGANLAGKPSDVISYSVKSGFTDSDRRFTFLPNADKSGFFSDGDFEGRDFSFNPSISYSGLEHSVTTVGYDFEREYYIQRVFLDSTGKSNLQDVKAQSHNDYYGEEVLRFGDTTVTLAGRENTNDRAKSRATWDASLSQKLPTETILRTHYGTSYRTPSLFELEGAFLSAFGRTFIGNPNLSPERGASFDFGAEQPFGDLTVGATYFRHDILNKIDLFFPMYKNFNGMDHSDGVESFAKYKINNNLSVKTAYTYTAGNHLWDVPQNQVSATLDADYGKIHGSFESLYSGRRKIRVFDNDTFAVDTLGESSDITFSGKFSYDINKNVSIYLRGENIFNEKYLDGGYRTPGTRVYGGAVISF